MPDSVLFVLYSSRRNCATSPNMLPQSICSHNQSMPNLHTPVRHVPDQNSDMSMIVTAIRQRQSNRHMQRTAHERQLQHTDRNPKQRMAELKVDAPHKNLHHNVHNKHPCNTSSHKRQQMSISTNRQAPPSHPQSHSASRSISPSSTRRTGSSAPQSAQQSLTPSAATQSALCRTVGTNGPTPINQTGTCSAPGTAAGARSPAKQHTHPPPPLGSSSASS